MGRIIPGKKIRCPHIRCRSTDVTPITSEKYKAGAGIAGGITGGLIFGPVGAAVGAATGFAGKKKTKFLCNTCGRVFTVKL